MRRAFLDTHYDSILSTNREKILEGGTADTLLKNALADNRMSLVSGLHRKAEIVRNYDCKQYGGFLP